MDRLTLGKRHSQKCNGFRNWKKLLASFFILAVCSAFAADAVPAKAEVKNANLFANGDFHDTKVWRNTYYVDPAPGRDRSAIVKQLDSVAKRAFINGEDGHVYAQVITPDDFPIKALNGCTTELNLKEALASDHECCFSFRYRGKTQKPKESQFYFVVNCRNGHKHFGNHGEYNLPLTDVWTTKEVRFKVSAGTATLGVNMGINGQGTCEFGDISIILTPVASEQK